MRKGDLLTELQNIVDFGQRLGRFRGDAAWQALKILPEVIRTLKESKMQTIVTGIAGRAFVYGEQRQRLAMRLFERGEVVQLRALKPKAKDNPRILLMSYKTAGDSFEIEYRVVERARFAPTGR